MQCTCEEYDFNWKNEHVIGWEQLKVIHFNQNICKRGMLSYFIWVKWLIIYFSKNGSKYLYVVAWEVGL